MNNENKRETNEKTSNDVDDSLSGMIRDKNLQTRNTVSTKQWMAIKVKIPKNNPITQVPENFQKKKKVNSYIVILVWKNLDLITQFRVDILDIDILHKLVID